MNEKAQPRSRAAGLLAVLALGLIVVAIVAGPGGDDNGGQVLSGTATRPEGAAALVLVLRHLGATVTVTDDESALDQADVALVLRDGLSVRQREALGLWVGEGGRLVIADPESELTPLVIGEVGGRSIDRSTCSIDALADAAQLVIADSPRVDEPGPDEVGLEGMLLYEVRDDAASCFGTRRRAAVVATSSGAGTIVAVGAPTPFVNGFLARGDNSILASSLLAPTGHERVVVLEGGPGVAGETSLVDLVPGSVQEAVLQLGVAFLLYALWRARRLGSPVIEPLAVVLPGSELVRATGALLQQSKAPERAAALVVDDFRRSLCRGLGLVADAPVGVIADAASARFGLDRDRVVAALERQPTDENGFVTHAREIESLRQEVFHGTHATA